MNNFFLSLKLYLVSLAFIFFTSFVTAADKVEQLQKESKGNRDFLLGHALKKAKTLQETYGDFSPFGCGLFPNGKVKYVWFAKPGEIAQDSSKALSLVRQTLQAQARAGVMLASCVVYKYGSKGNLQLNVELEYATGDADIVGIEFKIDKNNTVTFGGNSRQTYKPKVFVEQQDS